jgi:1-acyl-sn-glycerol-3-phosphate acyltransferase
MEKYAGFADKGTGIHPFIYPKRAQGNKQILTILIAILKLPLVLITATLFLIGYLLEFLLPLYAWQRLYHVPISRLFLFICGFYWIVESEYAPRKVQGASFKLKNRLIFANHLSYMDVIYLCCICI